MQSTTKGRGMISQTGSKKLNLDFPEDKGMTRMKEAGQLFMKDLSLPDKISHQNVTGQQSGQAVTSKHVRVPGLHLVTSKSRLHLSNNGVG